MAQIKGSICSMCYANDGFYKMYANTIEPAQMARLDAVLMACEDAGQAALWIDSMVSMIGKDTHFRWHDSGDLQSVDHLRLIVRVVMATPHCDHWLPTREYGMVRRYLDQYGSLPANLVIRLSAMHPDIPVIVPLSLRNVPGVTISNVHDKTDPVGTPCSAPSNNGTCGECRACWDKSVTVSYKLH